MQRPQGFLVDYIDCTVNLITVIRTIVASRSGRSLSGSDLDYRAAYCYGPDSRFVGRLSVECLQLLLREWYDAVLAWQRHSLAAELRAGLQFVCPELGLTAHMLQARSINVKTAANAAQHEFSCRLQAFMDPPTPVLEEWG